LVADETTDLDPLQRSGANLTVDFRRGHKLWENWLAETEKLEEGRFPFESLEVEEKCTRCVRDFWDVEASFRSTNKVLS
jgi:hypothetical protein